MKHLEVSFGMNYLSIENINVVLAGSILLGSKAWKIHGSDLVLIRSDLVQI